MKPAKRRYAAYSQSLPQRTARTALSACLLALLVGYQAVEGRASQGENAVDVLLPRVVKLYGLGVGPQSGYGSGILISADGLVLTVYSLLSDSENIRAVASDGSAYGAEVVHRDADLQLVLLRLKPLRSADHPVNDTTTSVLEFEKPFSFFEASCSSPGDAANTKTTYAADCLSFLRPGDWVFAAGNSFKVADGIEPVSVFRGVYSTRTRLDARRKVKDFPYHGDVLVMDAITSNPGAPGSAVVNIDGRLVGMVGRVVISNLTHTHLNYAIPRDVLWDFLKDAANPDTSAVATASQRRDVKAATDSVDAGFRIGRAGYRDLPPFVERVRAGSPADRAGLQKDDLILSINAVNVSDVREFDERWSRLASGDPIDLVLRRGRRILTVRIETETQK